MAAIYREAQVGETNEDNDDEIVVAGHEDDRDVAMLLGLGLSVAAIEKLWGGEGKARAAAERLMAERSAEVPIGRQASVGLELIQGLSSGGAQASADDVSTVLEALRAEYDEPPERFRDPIMLTLMNEPMVLSSGHTFDKSTIYDARGKLRFERCPLTRETVKEAAYPLVYLRREIVDFKLRRLDGEHSARAACSMPSVPLLLPPAAAAATSAAAHGPHHLHHRHPLGRRALRALSTHFTPHVCQGGARLAGERAVPGACRNLLAASVQHLRERECR